jgi:hypothetical protein
MIGRHYIVFQPFSTQNPPNGHRHKTTYDKSPAEKIPEISFRRFSWGSWARRFELLTLWAANAMFSWIKMLHSVGGSGAPA